MLIVQIHSIYKKSPDYKGVDQIVHLKMRELYIRFFPKTINEMIKFFKNTRPGCSYNLIVVQ